MGRETPYGDVLIEIETGLWEHHQRVEEGIAEPYSYNRDHFKAALKIFLEAILWMDWGKMEVKDIDEKVEAAEKLGEQLIKLVLEFTGLDTRELYQQKEKPK